MQQHTGGARNVQVRILDGMGRGHHVIVQSGNLLKGILKCMFVHQIYGKLNTQLWGLTSTFLIGKQQGFKNDNNQDKIKLAKVTVKETAYPVQESSWKLMTSWRSSRRNAVALEHVDKPALVLVQLVILPTDGAHLKRIPVQLASFLRINTDFIIN